MIATPTPLPMLGTMAGFRRFTVNEYHWLISSGFLTEDDDLELIEGYLVHKMARNPRHDRTIQRSNRKLLTALPAGWDIRIQSAITLMESEPVPDIAVVRGDDSNYDGSHPEPGDLGAVMEISDTSLLGDRTDKGRIYARASIPVFWIINLIDRQIEVYEDPSGATSAPGYGRKTIYKSGDKISLTLDGAIAATFAVDELLP